MSLTSAFNHYFVSPLGKGELRGIYTVAYKGEKPALVTTLVSLFG